MSAREFIAECVDRRTGQPVAQRIHAASRGEAEAQLAAAGFQVVRVQEVPESGVAAVAGSGAGAGGGPRGGSGTATAALVFGIAGVLLGAGALAVSLLGGRIGGGGYSFSTPQSAAKSFVQIATSGDVLGAVDYARSLINTKTAKRIAASFAVEGEPISYRPKDEDREFKIVKFTVEIRDGDKRKGWVAMFKPDWSNSWVPVHIGLPKSADRDMEFLFKDVETTVEGMDRFQIDNDEVANKLEAWTGEEPPRPYVPLPRYDPSRSSKK